MEKLTFEIKINAPAKKVWQVLWNDLTYRKWTSVFHEGSYAVSDWKEGSTIQFLGPGGGGMYSTISESKPFEKMVFTHLGEMKDFVELEENQDWKGAREVYILSENDGSTFLKVELDSVAEFKDYFENTFPKAMAIVKELAENPIMLAIETNVKAGLRKAWEVYTLPEHIMQWNQAADSWHCPQAENDLRVGGQLKTRMEAKDGSFGFDFCAVYDEVIELQKIVYTLEDGRKVNISFSGDENSSTIKLSFEAETDNSLELQQGGWQAILTNFKSHLESVVHA